MDRTKKVLKFLVKIVGILLLLFFVMLASDAFINFRDFRSALVYSIFTVFLFYLLVKKTSGVLVKIVGTLLLLVSFIVAVHAYINLQDFRSALVYSIFTGFLYHILYPSENNQQSIKRNTEFDKSSFIVRELMKIGKVTYDVIGIVVVLWYYFAPDSIAMACIFLYFLIGILLFIISNISKKVLKKDLPQSITVIISGFYLVLLIICLYYSLLSK